MDLGWKHDVVEGWNYRPGQKGRTCPDYESYPRLILNSGKRSLQLQGRTEINMRVSVLRKFRGSKAEWEVDLKDCFRLANAREEFLILDEAVDINSYNEIMQLYFIWNDNVHLS